MAYFATGVPNKFGIPLSPINCRYPAPNKFGAPNEALPHTKLGRGWVVHLLTLSLLLFATVATPAQTAISQKRIEEVVSHFETHAALIDSLACAFNLDAIPVLSVVGPEWVRYSMVRDMMETKALEFAYVRFGREAADFSIGPFQMKPSFIEDLEKAAGIGYASADPSMQRRLRLQRLKDIRWQFYYAFAFYAHSQNRFAAVLAAGESQQLAFIASAYNFGFTQPVHSIEKWQEVAVFPYGGAFRGRQESYAQVALRFYELLRNRRGEVW